MRLDFQSARTKAIVHAVQAFIIFIAWILTIAVYTRKGSNDGRTDYYFALVCRDGRSLLSRVPVC